MIVQLLCKGRPKYMWPANCPETALYYISVKSVALCFIYQDVVCGERNVVNNTFSLTAALSYKTRKEKKRKEKKRKGEVPYPTTS